MLPRPGRDLRQRLQRVLVEQRLVLPDAHEGEAAVVRHVGRHAKLRETSTAKAAEPAPLRKGAPGGDDP